MKDKVLYIIVGLLLGVIIMQWQQGPPPAQAQAPEAITGYRVLINSANQSLHFVMLSNGDVYRKHQNDSWDNPPTYLGNFWGGAPVPTEGSSFGDMKTRYGDGKQ